MGSALAEGNRATETAVFMRRLLRAGAVIVGRSATPEFIQHGTTESRINGVTRNPHGLRGRPGVRRAEPEPLRPPAWCRPPML